MKMKRCQYLLERCKNEDSPKEMEIYKSHMAELDEDANREVLQIMRYVNTTCKKISEYDLINCRSIDVNAGILLKFNFLVLCLLLLIIW